METLVKGDVVSGRRGDIQGGLWCALFFSIVLVATRATSMGDTLSYSNDIADHLGKSPIGPLNSLWEFGHLLWRPLGWILTSAVRPLLMAVTDWTPSMQASSVLIAVSIASSIVTVLLWYLLLIDLTRSHLISFAVTLCLACSHGFLLYAHTGFAYIPGLMCLTLSVRFLGEGRVTAGALGYAVSVLLWLPYILAGLALLLLAACPPGWNIPLKECLSHIDLKKAVRFAAVSGACVLIAYGLALLARQTSSLTDARNWYGAAGHGWSQNIRAVRIATGLPRSFFYLAKDGILYKRFLRHDPYAPVTMLDIATASLWKIGLFWMFAVSLFAELGRHSRPKWPLLLVLTGAGPVILFALFVFEPGSPERYLPAFPFLLVALGWVLRDLRQRRRLAQLVIALFSICELANNTYSLAAPVVSRDDERTRQRIAGIQRQAAGGLVVILTIQDNLEGLVSRALFGEMNSPRPFPLYDLIEPGTLRVERWRQEFATKASMAWKAGGEVWVTNEVWSAQPRPEWNWVEGDDPRVSWQELPRFFSPLQTDSKSGGDNGFSRLTNNEDNRTYLARFAPELSH